VGLSFALFATNILIKLIFDVVGVAAGSTFSAVSKSLVLALGLTMLGEAIALLVRSGAVSGLSNQFAGTNSRFPTNAYRDNEPMQPSPAPPRGPSQQDPRVRHEHHDHDHHDHHHNHHGLTGPR
jgi:hypothetical protein